MDWTKLFFSPEGRIGRQAYWIGWLVLLGVNSLLSWTVVAPLVAIYCWICISAKRFHDMGKSGWLAAIPIGASFIALFSIFPIVAAAVLSGAAANGDENAIAAAVLGAVGSSLLVMLAAFVIAVGFLIWQGVTPSDPGENRYGPPPQPAVA